MLIQFSPGDVSMPECREVLERVIRSLLSEIAPDHIKEAGDDWQSLPLKFVPDRLISRSRCDAVKALEQGGGPEIEPVTG
jgi:hypothetical protein